MIRSAFRAQSALLPFAFGVTHTAGHNVVQYILTERCGSPFAGSGCTSSAPRFQLGFHCHKDGTAHLVTIDSVCRTIRPFRGAMLGRLYQIASRFDACEYPTVQDGDTVQRTGFAIPSPGTCNSFFDSTIS